MKSLGGLFRSQWDRATAGACLLLGAVALIVGYFGVSGTPYTAEQMPFIVSGGFVGLFLVGVAATLWLSADLRDEWRKLDALEEHFGLDDDVLLLPESANGERSDTQRSRRTASVGHP
jgi:hypothetical protein